MDDLNRVLAALDLGAKGNEPTAGCRKAIGRAIWLARRVGASLTILHSQPADESSAPGRAALDADGEADTSRRRRVETALAELPAEGVPTEVVIRSGPAWRTIIEEVLRREIDIVLAGKRTGVHSDSRRYGTVARKLLRECPCAVWLEDPRESRDPSVILAATDLTPVGDRVVRLSASIAHALGAELHIIHAFSISMEVQLEGEEARLRYATEKREEVNAQIERVLSDTAMAGVAEVHVGLTSPKKAVLEGVARLRPGLVVMGTVSRGGIPGLLVGNTAEKLIDRLDCALLTLKPKDFVCPVSLEPSQ